MICQSKNRERVRSDGCAEPVREESQGGFTLIEVVIAIFLLMLGSLTILSLVDASARNNYRVEQSQVAVNQLEAELERIKQLPYAEVALASAPASSGDREKTGLARERGPVRARTGWNRPASARRERIHAGGGRHGLRRDSQSDSDPISKW